MKTAQKLSISILVAMSAGAASAEGPLQGNEVFNFNSTLSRSQVVAEAIEANKNGRIVRGELIPTSYARVESTLTRAQVLAEAAEAQRLGLVSRGNHMPQPSAEQLELIRLAGLRALQEDNLAQSRKSADNAN